jgi:hypothetical protein
MNFRQSAPLRLPRRGLRHDDTNRIFLNENRTHLEMFFPPIPEDLVNYLSDLHSPVAKVLSVPYVNKFTRFHNSAYEAYFVFHAQELLQLSFSDEKSTISVRAFHILTCGEPKFLQPIIESGSFVDLATNILSGKEVSPIISGRLSSLTLVALAKLPDLTGPSCGFVFRLLHHCENPSVFNLFETLTGDDPEIMPAQNWVRELGLREFLVREVLNTDFTYRSESPNIYRDPVYNRVCYFFELIARACRNPVLSPAFQIPEVIDCLKPSFPDTPDFVKISRWRAIVAVTCQATASKSLTAFWEDAINLLTEQIEKLKEYVVSALLFVIKLMNRAPLAFDMLLKSQMPQFLINLVLNFPNSTILHATFLSFVERGLTNPAFASSIVYFYVPVAIDRADSETNRVVKACCIKVMQLFLEAARKNPALAKTLREELDGVRAFARGPLEALQSKIDAPYGGPTSAISSAFKNLFGP